MIFVGVFIAASPLIFFVFAYTVAPVMCIGSWTGFCENPTQIRTWIDPIWAVAIGFVVAVVGFYRIRIDSVKSPKEGIQTQKNISTPIFLIGAGIGFFVLGGLLMPAQQLILYIENNLFGTNYTEGLVWIAILSIPILGLGAVISVMAGLFMAIKNIFNRN